MEFRIVTGSNEYIDPSTIIIYTKNRILTNRNEALDITPVGETQTIPVRALVAPINYFGSTRFKACRVYLNGTQIGDSNTLYPYRSYLETLLTYDRDTVQSQFQLAMFTKDTAGKLGDNQYGSYTSDEGNKGLHQLFDLTKGSKSFECITPIHNEIFSQSKFVILNNTELKLVFEQHDSRFSLKTAGAGYDYNIEIESAFLWCEHKVISDNVLVAHEMALEHGPAVFPVTRTDLKFFTFGAQRSDLSLQNLHTGQLPKRVIFGLVRNSAFNGSFTENPLNFENFNVNHIAVRVDGAAVPFENLTLNMAQGQTHQAYFALLHASNKLFRNHSLVFDPDEFSRGYSIYAFDLTPDRSTCNFNLIKEGTISLEIKLSTAIDVSVTLVCLLQFDDTISIDKDRNVSY